LLEADIGTRDGGVGKAGDAELGLLTPVGQLFDHAEFQRIAEDEEPSTWGTKLMRILSRKNLRFTVLLLTLAAFAGADAFAKISKCDKNTRLETTATIARGIDGDTVHIDTSAGVFSVRLLGIDTQETHFMGKSQGEWADKAAAVLVEMAPEGSEITLELGTAPCDTHGRVLAHLFRKGVHLNAEMVKSGLAVNYCVAPEFRYCGEFSHYTQSAITRRLGMFSVKNFELPYDFRRRIENAPQRSYVGDIRTKEVLAPGHQNEIPIANRVFFYTQDAIQPPYHLSSVDSSTP
jgi:micrococcal nuclease